MPELQRKYWNINKIYLYSFRLYYYHGVDIISNKTGMLPNNGHRIQGRSSETFIDAKDLINRLNLNGDEVIMDAGCGDAHLAIDAKEMMNDDAKIYALDVFEPSIEDLNKYIEEKNVDNIIPVLSDITEKIAMDDETLDFTILLNVFHGFVARRKVDEAISELKRVSKTGGKIAVMDYKKQEAKYGPPLQVRRSPEEIEEMFKKHDMDMVELQDDIGEKYDDGRMSHFLAIFEKK